MVHIDGVQTTSMVVRPLIYLADPLEKSGCQGKSEIGEGLTVYTKDVYKTICISQGRGSSFKNGRVLGSVSYGLCISSSAVYFMCGCVYRP